jgi:hypothetical protein
MIDTAALAPYAEGDFSVGRVLNRTFELLTRNFVPFFTVTAIGSLPSVLLSRAAETFTPGGFGPTAAVTTPDAANLFLYLGLIGLGLFIWGVLYQVCQAIVLYGAFQDMRRRRVSLVESLQVGLRRFFPIIVLAILTTLAVSLGYLALIVPGLILNTMWFVATPACVVERLGPIRSMGRSRNLTRGHRWKIVGLILLLFLISLIVGPTLSVALGVMGGRALTLLGTLIWDGVWGAFLAIAGTVAYHDLRVAKEGIDTHQIAAVFD